MDVRCPKCQTEYELDNGRLRPNGVTVKCANCEHVFRVQKNTENAARVTPTTTASTPSADQERSWLIRLEDGEIKVCRELATLQRWIVSGTVNRECEISRSGKKWKPLADLQELSSFFDIAEEATHTKVHSRPHTIARQPSQSPVQQSSVYDEETVQVTLEQAQRPYAETEETTVEVSLEVAAAALGYAKPVERDTPCPRHTMQSAAPPAPVRSPQPVATPDLESLLPKEAQDPVPAKPPAPWNSDIASNRAGPSAGFVHGASQEPVFTGTSVPVPNPNEFQDGRFVPTDYDSVDGLPGTAPLSNGAGKWIVAIALIILGGAGIALYAVLFRPETPAPAVAMAPDAGMQQPPAVVVADARPTIEPIEPVHVVLAGAKIDTVVQTALLRHDQSELVLLLDEIENTAVPGTERTVALARIYNALAQFDLDQGLLFPAKKRALKKAARKKAELAQAAAEEVLGADKTHALALIAKANALRIKGSPSREVERWLRKSVVGGDRADERYVLALLRARDRRMRDAEKTLAKLQNSNPSPRGKYQLAMLLAQDKKWDQVFDLASEIVGVDAEHQSAAELVALAQDKSGGDPADQTATVVPEQPAADSYERHLKRGDSAAETGNCSQAVKSYDSALEIKPNGVEALTGLGYCHLDSKEYAKAQTIFKTALRVSSRYQDALWGIAESYQQQGVNPLAIAAFEDFIEQHPASRRAEMARRQIERLGGTVQVETTPKPQVGVVDDAQPDTGQVPTQPADATVPPAQGTPSIRTENPDVEPADEVIE